jgi:phosphatidate cytidylyltransferase
MKSRVLTALIGIPIVIGLVRLGGWPFWAVVAALALVSLSEISAAVKRADLKPPLSIFFVPCAASLVLVLGCLQLRAPAFQAAPLAGEVALAFWIAAIFRFPHAGSQNGRLLLSLSLSVLALAYLSLWAFVILLRAQGEAWLWLALAGVWASDIAAFFVGRSLGKRPLSTLSPGKSWEGAVGGFAATLMACGAIGASTSVGVFAGLVCGVLVGIFAPLGDLAESLWKRELGVKDMGSILPGHGGVMDRCDSLLFAAVVVYATSVLFQLPR